MIEWTTILFWLFWPIAGYAGACIWDVLPTTPSCNKFEFFLGTIIGYFTLVIATIWAIYTGIDFISNLEDVNLLRRYLTWHKAPDKERQEMILKKNIRTLKWKGVTIFISW